MPVRPRATHEYHAGDLVADPEDARGEFAARLLRQNIEAYEVACVYLGERLGLYAALHRLGEATAPDLAQVCGLDARYVREWTEQQAVSGIVAVASDGSAAERRYQLPAAHALVLLDRDDPAYLGTLPRFTVGVWSQLAALQLAFRNGNGIAYPEYGADAREGQAEVNRAMFVNLLGSAWLPSLLDVDARLRNAPPARVADVGCGTGWSSIAIARAYPQAQIDGFDSDAASIEIARANAKSAGLGSRVRFATHDASQRSDTGAYDLVTVFEALHDMAHPVEALRAMRRMLASGGTILVADERALDRFIAPGPESERLYYGWSVLFCLPTSRAQAGSAATGAVMRPDTLREYAHEAGLSVEVAPIEHDLWRFYLLRPEVGR